jgi:hypothetical protein
VLRAYRLGAAPAPGCPSALRVAGVVARLRVDACASVGPGVYFNGGQ